MVVLLYISLLFLFLFSDSILRDILRWLRFYVTETLTACDFPSFYFSQHDAFLMDLGVLRWCSHFYVSHDQICHTCSGELWGAVVMKYHESLASEQVLMPKISYRNRLCLQILDGKHGNMRTSFSLSSQMGRRGRKREEMVILLIYQQNYGFHNLTIFLYNSLTFGDTFNKINKSNHWKGFQRHRISKDLRSVLCFMKYFD